ncbi:uncharacterized protein V6R79_007781 [Siganus canaliculatus]
MNDPDLRAEQSVTRNETQQQVTTNNSQTLNRTRNFMEDMAGEKQNWLASVPKNVTRNIKGTQNDSTVENTERNPYTSVCLHQKSVLLLLFPESQRILHKTKVFIPFNYVTHVNTHHNPVTLQ